MSREKKTLVIDSLSEIFSQCSLGILADYRGLSAPEMTGLRRQLRGAGVEFRVVKNTLARFAAEKAGNSQLGEMMTGPVAVAFGYGEETGPAKVLVGYIRDTKSSLEIKGGFSGDRVLSRQEVVSLADLPPREVLIARVIGGMQSPIHNLVSQLAAPIRGFVGVLQARIQQLEGA